MTCDSWGSYIYLRDVATGDVWSAGFQPRCVEPESYEVGFTEDRAEIVRRDGTLTTTLEITVSAEHDGEVRRVSVVNGNEGQGGIGGMSMGMTSAPAYIRTARPPVNSP